ncbi:MAG: hypothetical protein QXG01_03710 [Candidatus Bathyarchaeia archaeon]
MRTREPIYESERIFKGRGGIAQNTRPYHLYLLKPKGKNSVLVDGREFVEFNVEYLDARRLKGLIAWTMIISVACPRCLFRDQVWIRNLLS